MPAHARVSFAVIALKSALAIIAVVGVFAIATRGNAPTTESAPAPAVENVAVNEVTKSEFLMLLQEEQDMIIGFYKEDDEDSERAIAKLGDFATQAVSTHPNMRLRKVNHKNSPYMTARLLLTRIPELRLLIKGGDHSWTAYSIDVDEGSESIAEYISNRRWVSQEPIGSRAQMYCSPFNTCGKALAFIAENGSAAESVLPIPKWLAVILIPVLISYIGRFIINGMYAADGYIRLLVGARKDNSTINEENHSAPFAVDKKLS
ncbi:hypothetical protein H4R24_003151 [Coemansia sp. RSA 988]|nr:hypothetical protein H4R24_003151 [Coemansia sp. RSA 988]